MIIVDKLHQHPAFMVGEFMFYKNGGNGNEGNGSNGSDEDPIPDRPTPDRPPKNNK